MTHRSTSSTAQRAAWASTDVRLGDVESALESVLSPVLVVDSGGVIVFANAPALQTFGFEREGLIGQLVEVLVPHAAREPHRAHRAAFGANPTPRPMASQQTLSAVRRDGDSLLVEISLAPLRTEAGVFTTVVVKDVTARRAEEELRRVLDERRRHLELSQRVARLGSYEKDFVTGRQHWSRGLYRLLGYAPGAVTPTADGFRARIHPNDHAILAEHHEQLVAGAAQATAEVRLLLPDTVESLDGSPAGSGERWVCVTTTTGVGADGQVVRTVGTVQDVTERKRLERELRDQAERDARVASVLQDGLMPFVPRQVDGVHVASRYCPAGIGERIGGDWADVFAIPGGRIGLVIGDVAGHGIEASATMSRLQTLVRLLATSGAPPGEVIQRINQAVHQLDLVNTTPMATLMHAQLDPATGVLKYASAGHLPLILLPAGPRAGRAVATPTLSGPPVGAAESWSYQDDAVICAPGSIVIGFTDGLIERRREDVETNLNRLIASLNAMPDGLRADVETLADAVLALPSDPSTDDVAVVVLRCPETSSSERQVSPSLLSHVEAPADDPADRASPDRRPCLPYARGPRHASEG